MHVQTPVFQGRKERHRDEFTIGDGDAQVVVCFLGYFREVRFFFGTKQRQGVFLGKGCYWGVSQLFEATSRWFRVSGDDVELVDDARPCGAVEWKDLFQAVDAEQI